MNNDSNIFIFLVSSHVLMIIIILAMVIRNARMRAATEKTKSLFDSIISTSEDAIISNDLQGIITSWNPGAVRLFQYSADEIIGQDISVIFPQDRKNNEHELISSLKQNISVDNFHCEGLTKEGHVINISLTASAMRNSKGTISGVSKIGRDITQSKLNQDALSKSLKDIRDYKYALDEAAIVAITNQHGVIKYVNDNFCKISKYKADEVIGQDHRMVSSSIDMQGLDRDTMDLLANGNVGKVELKNKAKDGSEYWTDTTIIPFLDEQGKPYQFVAISSDISSRKQAQEENERKELRFRSTLDKMLEGVEIIGFDCRYLYVNQAYEKQVNQTKEQLLGYTVMEVFPGIEKTEIFEAIQRCFKDRVAIHLEEEYTFADQRKAYFEISFQPVPEGVFILSVDISEKKRATQKIQQSEERFRSLIENSYDIFSILDETFKPIYRSPSALRITGYTDAEREKIGGGTQQTHPDDLEMVTRVMRTVMKTPLMSAPLRFRIKHRDGHYLVMDGIVTNMLHNESVKGIVSNFRDITESQKSEEKIKESEKIYKTIASSIPGSVICLLDKDYRYLLVEGDMVESMGYSKEKLLGNKLTDVIPQDRVAEVLPHFIRVFQGESFTIENYRQGFDILSRFVPLRDEKNQVFAAMVVIFDVTELKHAQRAIAQLNIGLEQKIKERTVELEIVNKELESFSYSVAHDLRTPLRAINGYASMLEEDFSKHLGDEGKRLINAVERNGKKMRAMIDDLLAFSKLGRKSIVKSNIDMTELTTLSLQDFNLEKEYPGKIKINKLHSVMADFSLMKHVMTNLLSNALKYTSKKEKPVIEISSRIENEQIIYSVSDNGVGFDMGYSDKLFGVFQRLHSEKEFEGTGVGLAIVQRIIHRHSGKVWAISKINEGATFLFSLPATQREAGNIDCNN